MPRYSGPVDVGDVIVCRDAFGPVGKVAAWLIRLGGRLRGEVSPVNHAIVVHHMDVQGRWWGIEGRPGGVGWWELTPELLGAAATNVNTGQTKTQGQRYLVAAAAEKLLGVGYDWSAIGADAAQALRLWALSANWKAGQTPAHVVCSSFCAWAYEQVGLAEPSGLTEARFVTPADWDVFITKREWISP
jgi:hypothetical protein